MPDWTAILSELGLGKETPLPVSGGDISSAWRVGDVFLKTGPVSSYDMFSAEAEGLAEFSTVGVIRVPKVLTCGALGETAWLATEWLQLSRPTHATEARLGEQLALLHDVPRDRFGWHRDNTIGLTPQHNSWSDDWVDFFREHRLGYQLQLADENGYSGSLQVNGARLLERLPVFFENYEPRPALLHGDLWSGNWGCCDGAPVIFDPAVYYGDPESDLAMTRLFGGFGPAFYEAYSAVAPPAAGSHNRNDLYQLYHVLNHLNLFGSAYLGRAQELIDKLLYEVAMKTRLIVATIVVAMCAACERPTVDYKAEGAALLMPFKTDLKAALVKGMEAGPVEAISACRIEAPQISSKLSVDGVVMGRSSHKLRNSGNASPVWLEPILRGYADGSSDLAPVDVSTGDGRVGYVEPIIMQPMCLACHGEELQADVAARISENYPEDRATGFKAGDFRGVFWVEFPDR